VTKCARVAALRTAYPAPFGGAYIAEEMPPPSANDDEDRRARVVASMPSALPPAAPVPQLTAPATTVVREPGADDDVEPAPQQDGDPVAAAVAAIASAPSQQAAFTALRAARDALPKEAHARLMEAFNARPKGAA